MEKDKKESCLEVYMLGGFSLFYQGKEIEIGDNPSTKVLRLLEMLLYAGEGGMSKDELMRTLFSGVSLEEDINTFRVTVSSLRRLLRGSGLPGENYIRIRKWRYRFAAPFEIWTDVHEFRRLAREAEEAGPGNALELLREACRLYQGHFLPFLTEEDWGSDIREECRELHARCLERLYGLLRGQGQYRELEPLCARAAVLYPFGGWQERRMECLPHLGLGEETLDLYQETARLYAEEGPQPMPPSLLDGLGRMGLLVERKENGLEAIHRELKETDGADGAYRCSYPGFIDCCRTAGRLMERTGDSVYLMLCTLSGGRGEPDGDWEGWREVSEKLAEAIGESLGREAVYARYSPRQYLMLLPGVCGEECPEIGERIDAAFRRREYHRWYRLDYRAASLRSCFGAVPPAGEL